MQSSAEGAAHALVLQSIDNIGEEEAEPGAEVARVPGGGAEVPLARDGPQVRCRRRSGEGPGAEPGAVDVMFVAN